jgi:hypothetical protein
VVEIFVPHPPVRGRPECGARMGSGGAGDVDLGGVVAELQLTTAVDDCDESRAVAVDCVVADCAHAKELSRGYAATLDLLPCVACQLGRQQPPRPARNQLFCLTESPGLKQWCWPTAQ